MGACIMNEQIVQLRVSSACTYALPAWGPAVHQDSLLRLNRLHNRPLIVTCENMIMLGIIVGPLVGFLYLC